jgi:hypothetical protein
MAQHVVKWLGPAPLWRTASNETARLARPAILRFATDSFMEDFLALLDRDPSSIAELEARHETWRGPLANAKKLEEPIALERPPRRVIELARRRLLKTRAPLAAKAPDSGETYQLKLYQPAHQRYYLVASSLVCATAGFPDRAIDPGRQERVGFVLRRLFPKQGDVTNDLPPMNPTDLSGWDEHAFVQTPEGPVWRRAHGSTLTRLVGEEPLPVFPVAFQDTLAHKRRLLAGMIPVAKRETYLGAPREVQASSPGAEEDAGATDPRRMLFLTDVIAPWKSLVESQSQDARQLDQSEGAEDDEGALEDEIKVIKRDAREKAQTGTWYLLLDFEALLAEHLPNVLAALKSGNTGGLSAERRDAELAVFNALNGLALSAIADKLTDEAAAVEGPLQYTEEDVATSLGDALSRITSADNRARLERATASYRREAEDADEVWPDFLFTVADLESGALLPNVTGVPPLEEDEDPLQFEFRKLDRLADLITAALPPLPDGKKPAIPANARPGIDPRDGWFVIRYVYEQPECGALHPPTVSAPTAPFQLAGFFDPDAPARPIRIALPIDPTPEGLRKFDKKTFVVMSNLMCGHIDRLKQLSLADLVLSVLPFPFHKGLSVKERGPCAQPSGLALGMMCSLSLPIITICALILLMIIVNLLDLIFRWLPYFIICFPLPGFKGKKGVS